MAGGGGGGGGSGGGGGGGVSTPKAATLVVDQTPGQGDFTTIAAALAGLPADGGYILVREGTYSIAAGMVPPDKPVLIRGCGIGATILDIGSNAIDLFTLGGAGSFSFVLEDMLLRGDGTTPGQRAVVNNSSSSVTLRNVEIDGFDTALEDTASCQWRLVDSSIGAVKAIVCSTFNNVIIESSSISTTGDAITGGVSALIENSSIVANGGAGAIEVAYGSIVGTLMAAQLTLDSTPSISKGVRVDGCTFVQDSEVFLVDDFHGLSNCKFNVTGVTVGVSVTGGNCTIDGCRYTGPGGSKFVVESGGADSNVYSDNVGFSGSTVIGPDSIVDEPAEQQLALGFFRKHGLLPDDVLLEELYNFPAPDFQNLAGGALTISMTTGKFVGAAVGASNFGWDLLAEKSRVLMMLHLQRFRSNDVAIFFTDTLPAAAEIPDGSYLIDTQGGAYVLLKRSGGTFTPLVTVTAIDNGSPTLDSGLALFYDDATNRLVVFVRTSPECWFPIIDTTDASFTTMRYVGLRFVGSVTQFNNCPISIRTAP